MCPCLGQVVHFLKRAFVDQSLRSQVSGQPCKVLAQGLEPTDQLMVMQTCGGTVMDIREAMQASGERSVERGFGRGTQR